MALNATIYKAQVRLSNLDRNVYFDHSLTVARHPLKADGRLLVGLLAFATNAPGDFNEPPLELGMDVWEPDEPNLWQKDPIGRVTHWIEVGQPDEKRLLRTSAQVVRLSVYSFSSSTPIWWNNLENRLARLRNLTVWQIPSKESQALSAMAQRTMQLQDTVQDASNWVGVGAQLVEVNLLRLMGPANG